MLYCLRVGYGGEHVAHHSGVDADVLCLGRLTQPCRQEDVGWLYVLQRRLHCGRMLQVYGDGNNSFSLTGPPGHTVHRPIPFRDKQVRQVASHKARNANDQCCLLHCKSSQNPFRPCRISYRTLPIMEPGAVTASVTTDGAAFTKTPIASRAVLPMNGGTLRFI